MRRGDRVVVRRYGTRGRPPKGMQPTLTEGVLIKSHRHVATVDIGDTVIEVHRRQVVLRPTVEITSFVTVTDD